MQKERNNILRVCVQFYGDCQGFYLEDLKFFLEDFYIEHINYNFTKFIIVDSECLDAVNQIVNELGIAQSFIVNPKNTLYHVYPSGERVKSSLRCIPIAEAN